MVLVWLALLSSALGRCYAESEYGNWTEVESGRDYGGVGHVPDLPQPNGYQLYDRPGGQYDKWPLHTFTSPIGCGGSCWLKAALVGVVGAALLVKLPLLMLIKLALMKTAVPVALALTVAPLILPLLYELILKPSIGDESPSMSQGDTESTTTSSPLEMMMGRHRRDGDGGSFVVEFLRSPDCLKKIACTLGAEHAAAGYDEAIFWGLNTLEHIWPSVASVEGQDSHLTIKSIREYREAYSDGAKSTGQSCAKHRCRT